MATWQFTLAVIPRGFRGNIDQPWQEVNIDEKDINHLTRLFPPSKSWSSNLKIFGIEDGTCISVWSENGKPMSIIVRLDMRTVQPEDIDNILKFVNSIKGVFQDEDGHQIEPEQQTLLVAMKTSRAQLFVKNPSEFFSSLQQ